MGSVSKYFPDGFPLLRIFLNNVLQLQRETLRRGDLRLEWLVINLRRLRLIFSHLPLQYWRLSRSDPCSNFSGGLVG
jgi:hypothetical protein